MVFPAVRLQASEVENVVHQTGQPFALLPDHVQIAVPFLIGQGGCVCLQQFRIHADAGQRRFQFVGNLRDKVGLLPRKSRLFPDQKKGDSPGKQDDQAERGKLHPENRVKGVPRQMIRQQIRADLIVRQKLFRERHDECCFRITLPFASGGVNELVFRIKKFDPEIGRQVIGKQWDQLGKQHGCFEFESADGSSGCRSVSRPDKRSEAVPVVPRNVAGVPVADDGFETADHCRGGTPVRF